MNCKPGDLAVIVRSTLGNFGKIVRVIGPSLSNSVAFGTSVVDPATGARWLRCMSEFQWDVDAFGSPLISDVVGERVATHTRRPFPDFALRPLRDNEDEDEMLRIAGKPVTQGELSECLQKRME